MVAAAFFSEKLRLRFEVRGATDSTVLRHKESLRSCSSGARPMQSGERPDMGEAHKGFWESRHGLAKADRNGGGAMDQPRAWPTVKYNREHWEPGRSGLNPKKI